MKYNNKSKFYKDWTTKKLKDYAISYYELIYGEMPCYGTRDIIGYDGVCAELEKRGHGVTLKLSFN